MPVLPRGLAVAAAGLAVLAAAPASATSDEQTAVAVRHVTPTANSAEANALLNRLGNAALEACGAFSHSLPQYRDAVRASACWRTSMADAVTRIDDANLTNAFQRREKVQLVSTGTPAIAGN